MQPPIPWKIAMSVAAALLSVAALEAGVRIWARVQAAGPPAPSPAALVEELSRATIGGREIGNQMIVHNTAWFAKHPAPAGVTSAYVGTSRTKPLRPERFGIEGAVNGAGNSYNEISYGLLLQMEALRLQFPKLATVYVESSLLLRRPARLVLEEDHYKYLPLLEALLPLRDALPGGEAFRRDVQAARENGPGRPPRRLALRSWRSSMRLSNAFGAGAEAKRIPVLQDEWLRGLRPNGERANEAGPRIPRHNWKPAVTPENVTVHRMREIPGWKPWDGLFDLIAMWGRRNGIQVVLFQPPVRSDLHRFQSAQGLADHVADLRRVAAGHAVPFIDLNVPSLGYMDDWSLFSDEDHLETCAGSTLLLAAIGEGARAFREKGDLLPVVPRERVEALHADRLRRCG